MKYEEVYNKAIDDYKVVLIDLLSTKGSISKNDILYISAVLKGEEEIS